MHFNFNTFRAGAASVSSLIQQRKVAIFWLLWRSDCVNNPIYAELEQLIKHIYKLLDSQISIFKVRMIENLGLKRGPAVSIFYESIPKIWESVHELFKWRKSRAGTYQNPKTIDIAGRTKNLSGHRLLKYVSFWHQRKPIRILLRTIFPVRLHIIKRKVGLDLLCNQRVMYFDRPSPLLTFPNLIT